MLSRQRLIILSAVIIFLWISIAVFMYLPSSSLIDKKEQHSNIKSAEQEIESCKFSTRKLSPGFWRRVNLHKQNVPQSIKDSVSMMAVQSDFVLVQGIKVHYIYAKPKETRGISVLLLHGQSFTSETWNELGTIKLLSAMGFYPLAVDLPGFGKTPSFKNLDQVYFLNDLISSLNLHKPVLVSPSMSGSFSLKYLVEHSEELGGYIPVSPVRTSILNDASCKDDNNDIIYSSMNEDCKRIMQYLKSDRPKVNCIKVPSLIIWGERDKGENSAKLCLLPESQGAEIPEGKHAAYLSNPDLWHKLLYNFLSTLNETQSCS